MGNVIHRTVSVLVWADVDEGIADVVRCLNKMPGVRTYASCQGTIGEGGAHPYEAHVMVSWEDDAARDRIVAEFALEVDGDSFGTVRRKA